MSKVKVRLRVPTFGKKAGDTIEVEKSDVDRLVADGTVAQVKSEPKKD